MRVLALDSTSRAGSVALAHDGAVVAEHVGDPLRTHAERLPGDLIALLRSAGATLDDIDVFAVVAGPGSFTGIRIGIATMQGLALTTGRQVAAASALELLALSAAESSDVGSIVGVWIDAHRQDVYSALYRVRDAGPFEVDRLAELDPPRVARPDHVLTDWQTRGTLPGLIIGDGARLSTRAEPESIERREGPALAAILARWACGPSGHARVVHPAGVQPVYVRRPDAEIARERESTAMEGSPAGPSR